MHIVSFEIVELYSLAAKKYNTEVEQSFTYILSSVSSSLSSGSCFSCCLSCSCIKTITVCFAGELFRCLDGVLFSLYSTRFNSWSEEPKTFLALCLSSQPQSELFRMMLNVFRHHFDLRVSSSSSPASNGFDNCEVSAHEH